MQRQVYSGGSKVCYGYTRVDDKNHTPIIDEEAAQVVRRIFEMYASGIGTIKIAEILNAEGVLAPSIYAFKKFGYGEHKCGRLGIWGYTTVRQMLSNMVYLGHMPQLRSTSVSYKNHKRYRKDQSEWVIAYNTHEPIISQELWDRVEARRKSMAHGRYTKLKFMPPLSGFLYCADCGGKMKMHSVRKTKGDEYSISYNCGDHMRFGKSACFSHYINKKTIEQIVLDDIREMAQRITLDEKAIREEYIRQNAELANKSAKTAKKELSAKQRRLEELSRLIQAAYEDKVIGGMPEKVCLGLIEKYTAEQERLSAEIAELENKLAETENTQQSADDFMRDIKKYLNAPELTREMCCDLLERVVVGGLPKITGKEREIDIVYKVDFSSVIRYKFEK